MKMLRKINISKYVKKHHKIILVYLISLCFVFAGIIFFWLSTFKLPDLKSFETRLVAQSTKIYDRTGEVLLFDVNQDIKRKVVSYDEISANIKKATVAIEDADFYEHNGIQISAIIRAALANLTGGSFNQGGSTITQQVVKNSLLTPEKAISRKLKEWVLALKLEKVMSKEDILLIYLNESPYGGSIYGIEEASQTFFGKKVADVTLAEAAYLAAIPNAPTYFSPYGNNKQRLDDRKNLVLTKMFENNFITANERDTAKKERVEFKTRPDNHLKAPHFVEYIRQYLEEKYGDKVVREQGLKIITTLDYNLQLQAEETAKKFAEQNKINFNAENASLVGLNPKTGEILVMVGSKDYFDKEIDGNFNVALAKRQPGSTFKPFVYATAFAKGYTPETVVFDLPTEFQTTCDPYGNPKPGVPKSDCYMPENYDGKYLGPMTLRDALAQSRNIPAIKTLYLAGINNSLITARNMGITSLAGRDQYGLTLVLGGGEVSLLELTSTYGVFANEGVKNSPVSILKIENSKGEILEEIKNMPEQALDREIANKISDILADNVARLPAYGANSPLHFSNQEVAVKTGTTNDYRDVWIVGYTPNFVLGAWVGNNDNSSMEKKVAGLIIAPMWRAFMDYALVNLPKESFTKPKPPEEEIKPVLKGVWQGDNSFIIDTISGLLATDLTPTETRKEVFIPKVHEILFWVDKDNPRGENPPNPADDPQYHLWEYPVQKWLQTQSLIIPQKPTRYDNVHTKENRPVITLIHPTANEAYSADQKITVLVSADSKYPIVKYDFYVNNMYIGSTDKTPFVFSFIPNEINNIQKRNTLKIVAVDSIFNRGEKEINFTINE